MMSVGSDIQIHDSGKGIYSIVLHAYILSRFPSYIDNRFHL